MAIQEPGDRNFLDHGYFTVSPGYLLTLRSFRKVLKSRNATIKKTPENIALVTSWDEPLCRYGASVVHSRISYLSRIKPKAMKAHDMLSGGRERLDLEYCSTWLSEEAIATNDLSLIENEFRRVMEKEISGDIRRGLTMTGPHRDEMRILIDGKDIRYYGSRGQKRTALMALKLSELDVFFHHENEYPVLIIDDMASEFDEIRQANLIQAIPEKIQILISNTSKQNDLFHRPVQYFGVADGNVTYCR